MNGPVGLHLVIGHEPGFHRPWIWTKSLQVTGHLFKTVEKSQKCSESFYNGDTVQEPHLLTHVASHHTWQCPQVGKGFCYVRHYLMFEGLMTSPIFPLIIIVLTISNVRKCHQNVHLFWPSSINYLTQGVQSKIDFFEFSVIQCGPYE